MITEEKILEIRILSRRGMSIRSIARELRISRNTVRKYLRGEAVSDPQRRGPGRPRKLAPYEDWIKRRVEAAAPIILPATVLHREITAMGYDGTVRTVRRYVASLRPLPVIESVVRFETAPGHQAQMDWGEYRLGLDKVYAFVGVLCYSRFLYFEYVRSTRSDTLIACHRRMLTAFGGVPREILYDNMKTVVTKRNAYGRGRHRFHDGIQALAAECGFRPRLCQPYRPQTKGKVERAVDYIASSFFYPLITRLALEDRVPALQELNAEAALWCAQIANVRDHGTTRERPIDRLPLDQAAMQPAVPVTTTIERPEHWPRYPLQRSPRDYDAVLQEVSA